VNSFVVAQLDTPFTVVTNWHASTRECLEKNANLGINRKVKN
jgi:hypothetical protein